ncbi:hypothetical protein B0H10DRAFT_878104 [Mycena sp. CBHHK59/15]|nr:hypothetical protein B0H10DRAFT_878104 [Mycena sp. CBHHK59/15]
MPNLLARLRRDRTKSLLATTTLPASPELPIAPAPAPSPEATLSSVQIPPLERKIHPDLDSLVANYIPPVASSTTTHDPAAQDSSSTSPFTTPLRPSTRRHSIDGTTPSSRPQQTDTHLDVLPELPVPLPFTAQPQPPTRARRLITRLTGRSPTPPSSMRTVATSSTAVEWSTFGRRTSDTNDTRPHLTDFGRGSPAPSQATSLSHSLSQSQSPSQVNLGTPSTTSQQLEDSVTYSNNGHDRQHTPGSDIPSPSSGFTFGSQGRASGRASTSVSPPPPMPPLDHPAFRGPASAFAPPPQSQSQIQLPQPPQRLELVKERHSRSSASLPLMHSTSRRKRLQRGNGERAKAQDIFAPSPSPSRQASARRASTDSAQGRGGSWDAHTSREVVFLALGGAGNIGDEGMRSGLPTLRNQFEVPILGKFDARAKRVVSINSRYLSPHLRGLLTIFVCALCREGLRARPSWSRPLYGLRCKNR